MDESLNDFQSVFFSAKTQKKKKEKKRQRQSDAAHLKIARTVYGEKRVAPSIVGSL